MSDLSTPSSGNGKLLARIDERTQLMNEKIDLLCQDFNTKTTDHENRIRATENAIAILSKTCLKWDAIKVGGILGAAIIIVGIIAWAVGAM